MDIKLEGNQAAGLKEHALNLADDKITSLEKMGDMEECLTAAKTEKPNLCQISKDGEELSFLRSMKEELDKRMKIIQRQQESESERVDFLKIQVCQSNRERDEITKKYNAEVKKHSDSMRMMFNLQNQLNEEKVQHRQDNEALEAKIKSLMAEADLKEQETKQIQRELKNLKEDMFDIELTNENLFSQLNDTTLLLSLQREQWDEKCAALDKRYEEKVSSTLSMSLEYQTSKRILEDKYQLEMYRNCLLRGKVEEMTNERTVTIASEKQLTRARDYLMKECTLLEDICLALLKKCRGPFGKRMQDRNVELEKMKQKMRETLLSETVSETQTDTRDIDGPHCPPSSSPALS